MRPKLRIRAIAAVMAVLMGPHPSAKALDPAQPRSSPGMARDVSPPPAFASDDWVAKGATPWEQEAARRQHDLEAYLRDTDPVRARKYGFRAGHTPALAWNWFSEHPIGFGGMPYVLLQTLLSLDPATETDPSLQIKLRR